MERLDGQVSLESMGFYTRESHQIHLTPAGRNVNRKGIRRVERILFLMIVVFDNRQEMPIDRQVSFHFPSEIERQLCKSHSAPTPFSGNECVSVGARNLNN